MWDAVSVNFEEDRPLVSLKEVWRDHWEWGRGEKWALLEEDWLVARLDNTKKTF